MIYSFGSGFSLESNDSKYLDNIRDDIAYAHWNGIEVTPLLVVQEVSSLNQVGGYDLIALSRRVKPAWMAVNQSSACFASGWFDHLLNRTLGFLQHTGLSMLETDGPYGG